MRKFVLIKKKLILLEREPMRHFFKLKTGGLLIENIRHSIQYHKQNPKHMRLHIQIWLPFIHIERNNAEWKIGNRWVLHYYHR